MHHTYNKSFDIFDLSQYLFYKAEYQPEPILRTTLSLVCFT